VYETQVDITSDYQQDIALMRELARGVPGTNPNATVGPIYEVSSVENRCPSFNGCAFSDGHIEVVREGRGDAAFRNTIIHEIAHTLTSHESGHGTVFKELNALGYEAINGYAYPISIGGSLTELKDKPEAALPETTADEEVDASDFMGDETDLSGAAHEAPESILDEDPDQVGEVTDLPPIESRAWLMNGSSPSGSGGGDISDGDIALAAKQALKEFSPEEQRALIGEGELDGTQARNLDKLEVSGTHYEALERALEEEDEQANDDIWLLV
jgi:hypothetical protein